MKHFIQLIAASMAVLMLQSTASVKQVELQPTTPETAPPPAIIVHPSGAATTLTKDEIKDIFLGKTTTWKDGSPIVLFNLDDKDIHGAFTKEFTGKTDAQYENFWKKIVFTGKGKMPESHRNEKKMISAISKTAGSVGYVSAAASGDDAQMKDKDGAAMAVVVTIK